MIRRNLRLQKILLVSILLQQKLRIMILKIRRYGTDKILRVENSFERTNLIR